MMHIGWDINMRSPITIAYVVALTAVVLAERLWERWTR